MTGQAVGETIPALTAHAVSVSLPTWSANVGYEEGEEWVISKMKTGYPRFFINKSIQRFAEAIVKRHGIPGEKAMLVPSRPVANRCLDFIQSQNTLLDSSKFRILEFVPDPTKLRTDSSTKVLPRLTAVIYPEQCFPAAKTFWQHSGDGISSRRAEYCHKAFLEGALVEKGYAEDSLRMYKGPKRYQKHPSADLKDVPGSNSNGDLNGTGDGQEHIQFVEERFGRNLDVARSNNAKTAVRRRIAGSLTANVEPEAALDLPPDEGRKRNVEGFSEDDVYLYPCGMSAIYNSHRLMMKAKGQMKSIEFGFPYIDTLKVLEKFGPGCLFYGHGESSDLDDLEKRLENGERFLALFCEFPGNPLLKSPDLQRIRRLADRYDFGVVVDETIGNFLNVHVLPYADIVVTSLTKIFSGDSNVMGGASILNPRGKFYHLLKQTWQHEYEDDYWPEDAIFLERNSRDFVSRIDRINDNAEVICDILRQHPRIKQVNYPKYSHTRPFYDACRTPAGGYGGLLSCTFYSLPEAMTFYDNLDTEKGPSLGTNFTLASPFVILAHYNELDWAESFGAERNLVRFSVGLEEGGDLVGKFRKALAAMEQVKV
ncbi:MAG: hypothetical protein Q9165_001434 [Trypethelium subeluteriae]